MGASDWLGLIGIAVFAGFFVLVGLVAFGLDLVGAVVPRFGRWWRQVQTEVAEKRGRPRSRVSLPASVRRGSLPPREAIAATRSAEPLNTTSSLEPQPPATMPLAPVHPIPLSPSDYDIPDGYPANWHELRRLIYRHDDYRCRDCGADCGPTGVRPDCHHIVPWFDGGSHEASNLVTLCRPCHDRRHILISAERRGRLQAKSARTDWRELVAIFVFCVLPVAYVLIAILRS